MNQKPNRDSLALFQNPHLDGGLFMLEGGSVGILLCHGFTATTAEVRPLAERLHHLGYTIGAPLLPGHDTRPQDLNRVRWQDWVTAVEAMYACLKKRCSRVVVGGESTGAVLALELASRHPDVTAVLAYAPALRLPLRPVDRLALRVLAPFVPYVAKRSRSSRNVSDSLWKGYTVNPLKGTQQLLRLQQHVIPRLGQVTQPLLVVQGRLDQTVDLAGPNILQRGAGSAVLEIHWLENSGHTVIIDKEFETVVQLTQAFLQRVLG